MSETSIEKGLSKIQLSFRTTSFQHGCFSSFFKYYLTRSSVLGWSFKLHVAEVAGYYTMCSLLTRAALTFAPNPFSRSQGSFEKTNRTY